MKKIYSLAFVVLLLMAASYSYSQSTQISPYPFSTQVDAGVQCSGGQIHDDGVAENGYGWNASAGDPSAFCTKFIPTGYPYKFSKYCIALTRLSTGVANWTFKIMMWKSVNGAPGTKMDSVTVTATAVPVWPTVSFFDFVLPGTWANVTGTDSVYIGIVTNPVTQTGVFVASDESTSTPIWPGWATTAAGPWQSPTVLWAGYRAFLQRAEGSVVSSATYYSSIWCPAQTLPDMPSGQYFNAAAWLGDTLYVQTPAAGVGAATIVRYTMGGTWSTGVPLPTTKIGGTLTAVNGKLYYAGGGTSAITTPTTELYEYTPSTGTWVAKAPIPMALASHGAANWGDSVLFVFSGVYSAPVTNVYAYRPATDTWVASTPTPFARRTFAYGISGNKLFMAGGYNAAYMKDFAYGTIGANATTITWTTGPQIPVGYAGISRPGGTAYGDKFYVVSGERSGLLQSDSMWVWNINSGTWKGFGGKPTAVSNVCASVTSKKINDTVKVFVAGGYLSTAAGTPNLDYFGCGPTLTGIVWNQTNPETYKLSQNYPNPFNPVTKINYALPKSGFVTLKVYDILGKEVATLVNEVKNVGAYSIDFNGASLSSGVYFYRLTVGDFSSVKKMTLLK